MAVLVRAGSRTIPTVRRALTAAGVPLEIDGDDLPEGAVLLGRIARAGAPDQTDATASTSS
jgi:hypothetical protein